jgi:hypothetical protein
VVEAVVVAAAVVDTNFSVQVEEKTWIMRT